MTTTQNMIQEKKSSAQRLLSLEKEVSDIKEMIPALLRAIGKQIDEIRSSVNEVREVSDAIVAHIGVDAVANSLKVTRLEAAKARMEAEAEDTKRLVADGILEPASVAVADSLIVFEAFSPEGEPIPPGPTRLMLQEAKPGIRDLIVGRSPGDKVTMEDKTVLLIAAVYRLNKEKVMKDAQTKEG